MNTAEGTHYNIFLPLRIVYVCVFMVAWCDALLPKCVAYSATFVAYRATRFLLVAGGAEGFMARETLFLLGGAGTGGIHDLPVDAAVYGFTFCDSYRGHVARGLAASYVALIRR